MSALDYMLTCVSINVYNFSFFSLWDYFIAILLTFFLPFICINADYSELIKSTTGLFFPHTFSNQILRKDKLWSDYTWVSFQKD